MSKQKPQTPSWVPRCPYCNEQLEGVGWPIPAKGVGRCPNAGFYEFTAEVDNATLRKDKDGRVTKGSKWKVTGDSH